MKNLSPQEAITILNDMKIDIPVPKAAVTQRKRNVALDMAISALSCSEIPNNSNSISRQDAIEEIARWKGYLDDDMISRIQLSLKRLPSAESETCEDAVSRKAVEDMLKNGFPTRGMWEIEGDVIKQTVCETLVDALMDLEKLPSVTPQQPEVIRCKDCKYAVVNQNHPNKPLICGRTKMCGTTQPEWFCADGERRTDE